MTPAEAQLLEPSVFILVDEIRASTTITALLDFGCRDLHLAGSTAEAKRIAEGRGSLLVGERHARMPRGFDYDNSPTQLARASIAGRDVVLRTTNGTAVMSRLRGAGRVLVGCIRNARACAEAAVRLATIEELRVQVVCAGQRGRFVLEDTVAAGVVVARIADVVDAMGGGLHLTDGAAAAKRLRESYPDLLGALESSDGGRTLRRIGRVDDLMFCAEEDASTTVPILVHRSPMQIGRLEV